MSKNGLIVYDRTIPCTIRYNQEETEKLVGNTIDFTKYDEVCEVAHLEISNTCNMKCKYCYVQEKKKGFLSTADWKKIIRNLAKSGVFQVSFGGGEPTMRPDLFELAKYVRDSGMNLGMTTNGKTLHKLDSNLLKRYFNQINVSWHQNIDTLAGALKFLQDNDIPRGINYCFSKDMARDNNTVKFAAEVFDAELLYLVYKPVIKDIKNQIPNEEVYKTAKKAANEGLKVAVDGPCVNKCLMKKKFIDVSWNGDVYPCSFVRKSLGNLLKTNLKEIWRDRGPQDKCPFVEFKDE
jgi:MoaA/NifB/PqqE/SkfB family radical SAM enzyme